MAIAPARETMVRLSSRSIGLDHWGGARLSRDKVIQ